MDKRFLESAQGVIKDIYSEYGLSGQFAEQFAKTLCGYLDNGCGLNCILSLAYSFEESARASRTNIDVGCQCLVYERIVNILEVNEKNAHMLYESFEGYHDICAFDRLMTDFKEYLTAEEVEKIMDIARENFIKSCWEIYGEE